MIVFKNRSIVLENSVKNYIESLVRKVVIEEIDEQLKKSSAEKLSPEDFANKVASAVIEKIPVFEVNRYSKN